MPTKRKLTKRQELTVEGVVQGKSLHKAALDAGYSPHTAKCMPYKTQENARILEAVDRRREEAMKRANVHTDVIVGHLVEIMEASPADILPDHPV
jgi:phage terminase small subunit